MKKSKAELFLERGERLAVRLGKFALAFNWIGKLWKNETVRDMIKTIGNLL